MKQSPWFLGAIGEIIKWINKKLMSACDICYEKQSRLRTQRVRILTESWYGHYDYGRPLWIGDCDGFLMCQLC